MYQFKDKIAEEYFQVKFLTEETEKQLKNLKEGFLIRKHLKSKDSYYEATSNGEILSKALMADDPRVLEIKRHRFLSVQLRELRKNERLLAYIERNYRLYGPEDVNKIMPLAYRASREVPNKKAPTQKRYKEKSELGIRIPIMTGHTAADGTKVRSLAEMLIYNELLYFDIPFEYEKSLILIGDDGPEKVYPDFTIERADGTVCYWEHVGMFSERSYREKFYRKLILYYDNDIMPGTNLILTFSAHDNSINSEEITRIIKGLVQ